ncbi:hypothetical protein M0804_002595 [Polistes exclamans]|nr:hypothetical protein M0804_002595 [Polistes exclamans]
MIPVDVVRTNAILPAHSNQEKHGRFFLPDILLLLPSLGSMTMIDDLNARIDVSMRLPGAMCLLGGGGCGVGGGVGGGVSGGGT